MSTTATTARLDPKRMSGAAMRAFAALAEKWRLTNDEQIVLLGQLKRATFFKRRKHGGEISRDTLERISNLLAIYKSLVILIPDKESAHNWIRKPNKAPLFKGTSALTYMLKGNVSDINDVRRYLDAQRGAWA